MLQHPTAIAAERTILASVVVMERAAFGQHPWTKHLVTENESLEFFKKHMTNETDAMRIM